MKKTVSAHFKQMKYIKIRMSNNVYRMEYVAIKAAFTVWGSSRFDPCRDWKDVSVIGVLASTAPYLRWLVTTDIVSQTVVATFIPEHYSSKRCDRSPTAWQKSRLLDLQYFEANRPF